MLPIQLKIEVGDAIVALITKRKLEKARATMIWALGRLGQRVPLHGPLNTVVPPSHVASWLDVILKLSDDDPMTRLAAMQMARRTDDRHRDIDASLRERVLGWMAAEGAAAHWLNLVRTGGSLDDEERGAVIGESMPIGLRIN